ncbi:MAG: hypothetical protein ABH811_02045 [archaeon]
MADIIIIEGLKRALARGQSLENAMHSFYNSGYTTEEIEEAADALQNIKVKQIPQTQLNKSSPQRVSNYGQKKQKPRSTRKVAIVLLLMLLTLLLGTIVYLFLFKGQVLDFIDTLGLV